MKTITLRMPEEEIKQLDAIAKAEYLKKTEMARKLLVESIKGESLRIALEKYKQGKITLNRAAELTKIPLIELLNYLPPEEESSEEISARIEETKKFAKRVRK